MTRIETRASDDEKGNKAASSPRFIKRGRAGVRLGLRQLHQMRAALAFAALLAGVGVAMFSPLLLDDLAFLPSYLLRPSPDAIAISKPILVIDQPRMTVMSGTLSVPPTISGQARTGEALAALIKGGSARLALKQPVIHLELSPQADSDFGLEPDWSQPPAMTAASPLVTALEDGAFETLSVREATIVLQSDGRSDTLLDVSADITVKRKTAVRIKGSFQYAGETLTIDATLGARIGRGSLARMPLRAQVQNSLFNVSVDGRIELGHALSLVAPVAEIAAPNVRSVARWLGQAWPGGNGLRNFGAHGSMTWAGSTIAFQSGTFELDGNKGNGALMLRMGTERPSIAGTLAFQRADLSAYLSSSDTGSDAYRPAGRSLVSQLKNARDLTVAMIGAVDADLRFSADSLTAGPFRAGRTAASLALRDGHLLFNLADMELANGGSADGEIALDGLAATPAYTLHGRLQGGEMTDATTLIAGVPMLRGRGNLHFSFKAGGRAGMDLLSRLNGTLQVEMPRGAVASCSMKELSTPTDWSTESCRSSTSLAPFKGALTASNGVIGFDQVDLASGSNRIRLDGTVDLVTSAIHLNVSATPPSSAVSVAGELPPEVTPVREMIAIRGRTDDARITVRGK